MDGARSGPPERGMDGPHDEHNAHETPEITLAQVIGVPTVAPPEPRMRTPSPRSPRQILVHEAVSAAVSTPTALKEQTKPGNSTAASEFPAQIGAFPSAVFAVFTSIVNVLPPANSSDTQALPAMEPDRETSSRVLAARFLMSLFALDACSYAVGKLYQFEAIIMAEDVDWCYIRTALVIQTVETLSEFLADCVTPTLAVRLQHPGQLSSRQLVSFALRAYAASNIVAFLVYPAFGIAIYGLGQLGPGTVYLMVAARTLQYAFGNQVGDAAVKMSKPHWLRTFKNLRLAVPGCACCPLLVRTATADVLALYLTFARIAVFAIMASFYVSIRQSDLLRWGFGSVMLVWNLVSSVVMLRAMPVALQGIADTEVEGPAKQKVMAFRDLRWYELSFLAFFVVLVGVPEQAFAALRSALLLELPSMVQLGVTTVGGLLVLVLLLLRIKANSEAKAHASAASTAPLEKFSAVVRKSLRSSREGGSMCLARIGLGDSSSFLQGWLMPLAILTLLLGIGSAFVVLGGVFVYISLVLCMPVVPLTQSIRVNIDAYLLMYDPHRSSDVIYWGGVLKVLVNGPLLALNWIVVDTTESGGGACDEVASSGALLGLAVGALLLLTLYYMVVDARLPEAASLRLAVMRYSTSLRVSSEATAVEQVVTGDPAQ